MGLHYVVSDYYATGEGRTISILITYGSTREEDYENGELKRSMNFILLREFALLFDWFYYQGAEILTKEEFLARYKSFISESVLKMLESEIGNFHYYSQFHINLS